MTDPLPNEGPSLARPVTAARQLVRDRTYSFQLVVYASIFVFVVLYVFSVKGAEILLDRHFRAQVERAIEDPDPLLPVAGQIQDQIRDRILTSRWVRVGGVRVTVIVLGRDGTYLYVGGRVPQPPANVEDVAAVLRESQRLLPATGEAIVAVPHNTVLSNALLLFYAALLLQGLFVYNRIATRRDNRQLDLALRARDGVAARAAEIEAELEEVRQHLATVEPAEREHSEEIRVLQHERETLQRKLTGLAAREEELRGKAQQAVELDQERRALEDLLEEASADITSKDDEITQLQTSLKRASRSASPKARGRESDVLGKRLRTLYKTLEIEDKAVQDLVALRDEGMKLKAEEAIKRLADDADNVAVRRKVGGLPPHLSIFELGFAGKGRIYYTKGRQRRFRLLAFGAKNSQKTDLEYLSRLPRED